MKLFMILILNIFLLQEYSSLPITNKGIVFIDEALVNFTKDFLKNVNFLRDRNGLSSIDYSTLCLVELLVDTDKLQTGNPSKSENGVDSVAYFQKLVILNPDFSAKDVVDKLYSEKDSSDKIVAQLFSLPKIGRACFKYTNADIGIIVSGLYRYENITSTTNNNILQNTAANHDLSVIDVENTSSSEEEEDEDDVKITSNIEAVAVDTNDESDENGDDLTELVGSEVSLDAFFLDFMHTLEDINVEESQEMALIEWIDITMRMLLDKKNALLFAK